MWWGRAWFRCVGFFNQWKDRHQILSQDTPQLGDPRPPCKDEVSVSCSCNAAGWGVETCPADGCQKRGGAAVVSFLFLQFPLSRYEFLARLHPRPARLLQQPAGSGTRSNTFISRNHRECCNITAFLRALPRACVSLCVYICRCFKM